MQKVWVLYCLQRTKATVMQWLLCLFVSLTLTLILIYFSLPNFVKRKRYTPSFCYSCVKYPLSYNSFNTLSKCELSDKFKLFLKLCHSWKHKILFSYFVYPTALEISYTLSPYNISVYFCCLYSCSYIVAPQFLQR